MEQQQSYAAPHQNGSSPIPKLGIAGGAALGGGTLVVLARRRARRKREEERSPRKKVEVAAHKAASTARDTATTVGSRVRDGVDRMAEDRTLQTFAIAGAVAAWLFLKVAELRHLRRLSKSIAAGG
jgi:hypothetical protein